MKEELVTGARHSSEKEQFKGVEDTSLEEEEEEEQESLRGAQHTRGPGDAQLWLTEFPTQLCRSCPQSRSEPGRYPTTGT